MHTLANLQSENLSTSSKTSTNVLCSPSGTIGKRDGTQCNTLSQNYKRTQASSPPAMKTRGPPKDIGHEFDTSDSDDCESIASNSSTLENANERVKNLSGGWLDNATSKSPIQANNMSIQEKSGTRHGRTRCAEPLTPNKTKEKQKHESKSTHPNSRKNSSCNSVISHEKEVEDSNINMYSDVRLNKHLQVGEVINSFPRQTQQTRTKGSSTGHTNYDSSRNVPQGLAKNAQRENKFVEKPDARMNFDEGDGGGPPITTSKSLTSEHNNIYAPSYQHRNQEDQEYFDMGDGGRYNSSKYVPSRKGRLLRHGRRSRERGGRSRRGSRQASRSSSRSRTSSQGSSGHSSKGHKRHRRKRKGDSNQSRSESRSHSSHSSSESWRHEDGLSPLIGRKPYPANWRCFGRRPPAIHEFRPLGDVRLKNVRPAGKLGYLARIADVRHGCQGPYESDIWDTCYGLAKPLTSQLSTPIPYGTQVIRAGDIDPHFRPSRGDLIIINPAQNLYRAMKSGYVMTYRGRGYSFGVGDLIVRLGRFMPNGKYIPYGNLELYMHTESRDVRLLGRQPSLLVDFNYHNLDYESPGKYLDIGTFLNEIFFPRRGDIIIRGGAWAENYPNVQRKHHSSVKYWRPRMEFLPNDMLLRPYVDIGRKNDRSGKKFYWGAAELYTYSGKGLAWAYWGRDHHICDKPFPREQEHGIKTGHHKDEVGHYGEGLPQNYGGRYDHGHGANDGCHTEHQLSAHHRQHSAHSHQANDDCHREHDLSHHNHRN